MTRYADVTAVLRDARYSSDERKQSNYEKMRARAVKQGVIDADESYGGSMLRVDPPDHTRLRTLVSRAFTPRTVEGLRRRVEAIVEQHLDAVAAKGGMDVIAELAYPWPVIIMPRCWASRQKITDCKQPVADEVRRGLVTRDQQQRHTAVLVFGVSTLSLFLLGLVRHRIDVVIDPMNPFRLLRVVGVHLSAPLRTAIFLVMPLGFGVALTAMAVQTLRPVSLSYRR